MLKTHISIFENFNDSLTRYNQLDFLSFWVKKDSLKLLNPFKIGQIRDNPNWELTEYDNVYQFVDEDKIILQYIREWYSPVVILQWYKIKTPTVEDWKISIYGKGLKLYYSWYLDWLPDYINQYAWEVVRADLCWDNKNKIPEWVVDLPCKITIWNDYDWTYKGFGNKNSPLFIRIYDKTLDLKKDKNSMSRLYPERYTSSCWRIEAKFTWRYAKSLTPLEWLWIVERNWKIKQIPTIKRNYLKSAFYNLLMYLDYLPDKRLQYDILDSVRIITIKKIKKLKDFISINEE